MTKGNAMSIARIEPIIFHPSILYPIPQNHEILSLTGGNRYCSQFWIYTGHCYLLDGGSLFLRHFLTHMHLSVLHWILIVGKIHIFLLCAEVSSYESCPVKSWCLGLSRFSASSLQFREITGLYLSSFSLFHSLGTLSEQ